MESELATIDLNKTFAQRFWYPIGIALVQLPDDEWTAGHNRLTELMGLANTATAQFRAVVTTLAPLLTGLLAYFLK
ncbi:hypothetical protein [Nocardia pseudovaccinii]|uniref:hypothetical protein n=1 Tax=Nocardia pseudovaccinii TaxID=189540 RepID=UPI0007A3D01A|nr:hypothetical protein [Nocardia pseudovaccinii]